MSEPVFEWYKDKAGKYRFRLKAANGEIIAVSEGYSSKEGCVNGIESVKKNSPIAKIVEATITMTTLRRITQSQYLKRKILNWKEVTKQKLVFYRAVKIL